MNAASIFFVAYIGVIVPFLVVRRSRMASRPEGPLPARTALYAGTLFLQAIYFVLAVAVANVEEISLFTPVAPIGYGLLVAFGWLVAKLVIVEVVSTWWPPSRPELLLRLAPELEPKALAIFALICATTGVVEEITFRVVLPEILLGWGLAPAAVWILSSLIFGVGHAPQGLRGCVLAGLLGGVNLLLFWHLGSIWPLMLSHALYDFARGLRIAAGARSSRAPGSPAPQNSEVLR